MGCGVAAAAAEEEEEEEVEEDWQIILKVSQSETCRTTLAGEDKLQREGGPVREMEAGGAKSKKALASKANRSVAASSAALVSPLFVVRSLRPKCCRMLGERKGKDGGNARSIWRGLPYCFALME